MLQQQEAQEMPVHCRLTLVIPGMSLGGAERVLSRLANCWATAGVPVTLITLDTADNDTYQLHAEIKRVGLDVMHDSSGIWEAIRLNRERVRKLRAAILESSPDCVISFTDIMNTLTLMACKQSHLPVIISERADPRQQPIKKVWKFLKQRHYPHAAALVVQTKSVAEYFKPLMNDCPIVVIPNMVMPPGAGSTEMSESSTKTLLAMGRLAHEKGFDLLIQAFAQFADRTPEWNLKILGEGDLRQPLQQQIDGSGLSARIQLAGWDSSPDRALCQAGIFVLSSRHEGFPNALLEAMSHGLPVIAFDCESGPRAIVVHEQNGYLVEDGNVSALAAAMEQLMNDAACRNKLGTAARQVVEKYDQTNILQKWNQVIRQAMKSRQQDL